MLSLGLGLNAALLSSTRIIPTRSYGVLGFFPEFVMDFDDERYFVKKRPSSFSDAITHTRASTATYVDADGILQTAATNVPRVGHHVWNGSAWVNEGLLHESEARTNLLLFSQTVLNTGWVMLGAGATGTNLSDNALGVFGGVSIASGGGNTNRLNASDLVAVTSGQSITFRVWVKAGTSGRLRIHFLDVATTTSSVVTGSFGSLSNLVGNIGTITSIREEDWGNGIVAVSGTLNSTVTSNQIRLGIGPDSAVAGETVIAYAAQLEVGPTPSSYIPTAGSAVTRAADVLTVPAANLPYNSTALSIQMDGRVTYADEGLVNQGVFARWLLDTNNRITHILNTLVGTGRIVFRQDVSGTATTTQSAASIYAPDILVPFNIAGRHGSTFVNGAVDGVALTANTNPTALPDLSTANLSLGFDYNGTIRTFRMWGQDITDAGLVEATT